MKIGIIWISAILLAGCYQEKAFPVKADFSIEVVNNDYSVPVKITIINTSTGAENYHWTMEGALPANTTEKDPGTVEYDTPGIYQIKLEADNQYGGKDSAVLEIRIDAAMHTDFMLTNAQSWYPPVFLSVTNKTQGANAYEWTFAGGSPSSSTNEQPGQIIFSKPGQYQIKLSAGNGREMYSKDTTITVLPDLVSDFQINWSAEDADMEVPFSAVMQNSSISATGYEWTFSGGSPAISSQEEPVVRFTAPGNYTITLKAKNDKSSKTIHKNITLRPNSNLYKFTDIRLGINTAQQTLGSFFSSTLGRVLKTNEISIANGKLIDFVFFGLNSSFSYNKFLPPDSAQFYTFPAIPGAITALVINRQEDCDCGPGITVSAFDNMINDDLLRTVAINSGGNGKSDFDKGTLPRIVLFHTADGRKGAIKIKQMVEAGLQSYIVCDVKVMKEG